MSSALLRSKELNLAFSFVVVTTQVSCQDGELVEDKLRALSVVVVCLDLRLIDWLPNGSLVVSRMVSVDQEEEHLSSVGKVFELNYWNHDHLFVVGIKSNLFTSDLDHSSLLIS
jgi:hypothetical protein